MALVAFLRKRRSLLVVELIVDAQRCYVGNPKTAVVAVSIEAFDPGYSVISGLFVGPKPVFMLFDKAN